MKQLLKLVAIFLDLVLSFRDWLIFRLLTLGRSGAVGQSRTAGLLDFTNELSAYNLSHFLPYSEYRRRGQLLGPYRQRPHHFSLS